MTTVISARAIRRPWAGVAGLAVLLIVAIGAWWSRRIEAHVDPAKPPLAAFDDYVYYYPTTRFAFAELRAGRLPLWNPHQHAGTPFLATGQHGLLYPPNLLYLALPMAIAERAAAVLHLTLAGLGAALLARAWRQSWIAATTAGVAFALAPAVTGLVYLPPHLYAVAWIPWQLLLLDRMLAAPRPWAWAVLLGMCCAAQYLGGYPMFGLMAAYLLAAYFCFWHWRRRRLADARHRLATTTAAVTLAALLAAAFSAPDLLPRLELARLSLRGLTALSLEQAAVDSVPPWQSVLRALLPMHDVEGVLPHAYLAVPLLLLAGLGVAARSGRSAAWFLVGTTVVSWVLAWGTYTPLFRLYYALPGGGAFRCPYRFFPVTALGVALLCGGGVDALERDRVPATAVRATAWAVALLGLVLILAGRFARLPDAIAPPASIPPMFPLFMMPAERPASLVTALGWRLIAATVWLVAYLRAGGRSRRMVVATLPVLVYATLFVATRNSVALPFTHPELHTMPETVAAFLRERQGIDRTYVAPTSWPIGPPGRHLPARSGMLHGLYAVNDRENVYAKRFAEYVALMLPSGTERDRAELLNRLHLPAYIPQGEVLVRADSPNLRLLDLLGTHFVVEGTGATFHADTAPERFERVFDGDGVRIYRNVDALPRAFLVHAIEVTPPDRVLDRLVDPAFDPRTTALVEVAPPVPLATPPAGRSERTQVVRYAADEVVIDVDAAAAGLLVLTDQHYPGWTAEVDGRPTPILVTDYVFRGVPVGPGTHRLVFRFAPRSFRRGLVLAGLGLLVACAAVVATSDFAGRARVR